MPLSRAGIIAGSMLVFIPCVGEYVIPELLGGPQTQMIGRTLWDEFFSNNDWPMACAVAVAMILLVIVPLALFSSAAESRSADMSARHGRADGAIAADSLDRCPRGTPGTRPASAPQHRAGWLGSRSWLAARLAFPLRADRRRWCVFSFNDSPVANVWRGFTLKWYRGARHRPRAAGRPRGCR